MPILLHLGCLWPKWMIAWRRRRKAGKCPSLYHHWNTREISANSCWPSQRSWRRCTIQEPAGFEGPQSFWWIGISEILSGDGWKVGMVHQGWGGVLLYYHQTNSLDCWLVLLKDMYFIKIAAEVSSFIISHHPILDLSKAALNVSQT